MCLYAWGINSSVKPFGRNPPGTQDFNFSQGAQEKCGQFPILHFSGISPDAPWVLETTALLSYHRRRGYSGDRDTTMFKFVCACMCSYLWCMYLTVGRHYKVEVHERGLPTGKMHSTARVRPQITLVTSWCVDEPAVQHRNKRRTMYHPCRKRCDVVGGFGCRWCRTTQR